MLSDIISVNSNASINPERQEERTQTQQLVHLHGSRYRVLARQYTAKSAIIAFWCVFWMTSTIITASLLLNAVEAFSGNYVFFSVLVSEAIFIGFGLYHRKHLQKMLAYSIANITICTTVAVFFLLFSFKFTFIPISAAIIIQLGLSIAYIKKRGKVMMGGLLLGECLLISVRADDILHISWAKVLIALIPVFIFLAAAFVFILIYTVLLNLYYNETFKAKRLSLIFLILNLGSFALLLSIPLAWSFLRLDLTLLCILAMGMTSTNSTYLWIYHEEIALYFCLHKHEVFDSDKQMKIELIPIKMPNRNLYRLSENWFGYQIKDSSQASPPSKYPQCLVCTQRESDIVWLPCGHLSLCTPCCKDVIQSKMISCILCKQRPTHLCKVKQRDPTEIKLDKEMGLAEETSKHHSECVVEQYQVRIS